MSIRKLSLAVGLLGAVLFAAPSSAASPEGTWEIEMRDSRYHVTLCGDGTALCAELIWLGNGADNAENMPYLNTMLIDNAAQTGPGEWRGELNIYGQRADGTITQVNDNQISLKGCVAWVVCKSYQMYRYTQ